jgi:DNA-binding transcriptional ArsR family regulator
MLYKCNMYSESEYDCILKALGHAGRRKILDLIKGKPHTTMELCLLLKEMDRCTVMQHLNVLEKADLIIVKHIGKYRWNYINLLPIKELHARWITKFSVDAIDLLAKLKQDMG